jgi:hypothetical protein
VENRPVPLALAAIFLGIALQISNCMLDDNAMLALTLCLVCAIAGVALPRMTSIDRLGDNPAVAVMAIGLVLQFGMLLGRAPGVFLQVTLQQYAAFQFALGIAAVLAGLLFGDLKWTRRVVFPLLLVSHFALGVWVLHSSPDPTIDVSLFHRGAFEALQHGVNPHTQTIPNVYGSESFYGEGIVQNGRVQVGYPYPPLSLFLTFIAHQLTGDYRSVLLLAMAVAAAAIGYSRSSRLSFGAAALFLFTPRTFFVLEQGWTDCLAAMFFCVMVFVACRRPRWLWIAAGLMLAVKQYMVGVLPLFFLLWSEPSWKVVARETAKALVLAGAITLPVFLWNPAAFIKDVVIFQIRQPFRMDALSYLAFFAKRTGTVLGAWVGFVAVIPAAALGIWRAPRTPAGFSAASALLFLAFVAFNKQAFCNYYYFAIAALAAAAGTVQLRPTAGTARSQART